MTHPSKKIANISKWIAYLGIVFSIVPLIAAIAWAQEVHWFFLVIVPLGYALLVGYWRISKDYSIAFPVSVFWVLSTLYNYGLVGFNIYAMVEARDSESEKIAFLFGSFVLLSGTVSVAGLFKEVKNKKPNKAGSSNSLHASRSTHG
jgi:hypothetical protein